MQIHLSFNFGEIPFEPEWFIFQTSLQEIAPVYFKPIVIKKAFDLVKLP